MSPSHRPRRPRAALLLLPCCGALACASHGAPAATPSPTSPSALGAARRNPRDTSSVDIGDGKSIERLFRGRFAGVDVTTADGGLRIRVRGGATSFVNGDEPLFVVDGTPVPQGSGGILFLNPYDITNIQVLKNPADVGVYGIRGANGVVLITTTRPGRR
ncbi:hypothetical protein tb265_00420 [Gemmatimonadetes bacterium T265]|nr:hypothetical protein tb265_00420 [Gemmatimonadetes bacterium T265]